MMLIQSAAIQADQSAPLVAAEVRAAEARQGKALPSFDGKVVVLADASGGNAPPSESGYPLGQPPAPGATGATTGKPAGAASGTTGAAAGKPAATSPALAPKPGAQGAIAAPPKANDTQEARIVAMIHNMNQMEIRAGKLAEKNGHSKGIKDFGAMLVHDHQAADKKVLSYASERGINPKQVPAVMPEEAARQRSSMDRLAMLSGANFDHGFATNMLDGHAQAIDVVRKSRASVNDPKLRDLLGELQPTLEKHEETAQKLAAAQPSASAEKAKGPAAPHGRRPATSH